MEFPMKKEDLINYRNNSIIKEKTDDQVNKLINRICSGIENVIKTTDKHYYIYYADRELVFGIQRSSTHLPSQQLVINKVLEELKMKFPDSTILLDPLQKIIKVDWSKQGPYDWHG